MGPALILLWVALRAQAATTASQLTYQDRLRDDGGPALVVNTTDDTDDGACDAGHCSLREAIQAANTSAGPDTIAFDIPPLTPTTTPPAGGPSARPARCRN